MAEERKLRIILADDEKVIHEIIGDYLKDAGHRVHNAYDGKEALGCIEEQAFDMAIIDLKMPKIDGLTLLNRIREIRPMLPVIIATGHGSMETAIQALRSGADDFLVKPVKFFELDAVLEKSMQIGLIRQKNRTLTETISAIQSGRIGHPSSWKMVGVSPAITQTKTQIRQIVESGCDPVLITGETGCGKEVAARRIHREAFGEAAPFIAVSCPAIPETLFESELFGYERGAFTGAGADKTGIFEMADGGTLFLDEISEISPSAQAVLLRVIEERKFRRVGGRKEIKTNVRIIAASNANLEDLMETGRFRTDLYYRLAVYPIYIPPLRQRKDDIIPLAEHFFKKNVSTRNIPSSHFSEEAKALLMTYDFPGNVRDLRNIVARAAILAKGGQIIPDYLFLSYPKKDKTFAETSQVDEPAEREQIIKALDKVNWNRKQAACNLGIPYSTLRYKIKTLRIA